MKSLDDVVIELARRMYSNYMSGSNQYFSIEGETIICFIYGITPSKLNKKVRKRFRALALENIAYNR